MQSQHRKSGVIKKQLKINVIFINVCNLFEATAVHDAATSDRTSSASSLKNSDKSGSVNKFDLSFFSTKRYQHWQLYNSLDLEASDYKNVT